MAGEVSLIAAGEAEGLRRSLELDGVAGFVEGRAAERVRAALNREGGEWVARAFTEAMQAREGNGVSFGLREVLVRGPEIQVEVRARLARDIQEWLPANIDDLIIKDILGDASGDAVSREAAKIAEGVRREMQGKVETLADAIAAEWYDAAVDKIRQQMMGATGGVVDPTDLRGTIDRAFDLKTMGDIAAGRLGAAIGEGTAASIRRRVEDALAGNLPPELMAALQRGPEEFEKYAAKMEEFLPGNQLERARESLLNRPVVKLPSQAYAAILAATAAGHFARAFKGPLVDAYELARGVEVTNVMIWQLENREWIALSVLQLGTIARDLARAAGAGKFADQAIEKLREPLDKLQGKLDRLDEILKKPVEEVRRELEEITNTIEKELKEFQERLLEPLREGFEEVEQRLDEAAGELKEGLPEEFNGIPATWEDLKKRTGLQERVGSDREGAPPGPAASILPGEELPARNPSISEELDPVFLSNGEFIHRATDLVIPGRGLDVRFSRIYRSRSSFLGELGENWTHTWAERLLAVRRGEEEGFTHVDGEGLKFFFRREGGSFISPPGIYARLVEKEDGGHELVDRDGVVTLFDADGRLAEKRDRYGNRLRLLYDDRGLLRAVVDPFGRQVEIERRRDGLISCVRDFAGRELRYAYNDRAELIGATSPATSGFPRGKTTAYRYARSEEEGEPRHAMTMIMDPHGQVYLRNRYDALGRVLAQRYGEGAWTAVAYADASPEEQTAEGATASPPVTRRAWVTDAAGIVRLYEHDAAGHLLRKWRYEGSSYALLAEHRYDGDGERVRSCLPSGRCWAVEYGKGSAGGRAIRIEEHPSDGSSPRVTAIEREARFGRPLFVRGPDGIETIFEYQNAAPFDLAAVFRRDGRGGPPEKIVEFSFNSGGQIEQEKNARGEVTRYRYHPSNDPDGDGVRIKGRADDGGGGHLWQIIREEAPGQEAGLAISPPRRKEEGKGWIAASFAYDPVGNVVAQTDGEGFATKFVVNALNQIIREARPGEAVRTYRFDANDNLLSAEFGEGERRLVWSFERGPLDRLVAERVEASDGTALERRYDYDAAGNVIRDLSPGGVATLYRWDSEGRLLCIVRGAGTPQPLSECVERDADGEIVALVDGEGHRTRYERDGFGEIVRRVDPLGNALVSERDSEGRVVGEKFFDAAGALLAETRFAHDAGGNLVRRARRLWRSDSTRSTWVEELWEYDVAGNLLSATDPRGFKTSFVRRGMVEEEIGADGLRMATAFDRRGLVVERAIFERGSEGGGAPLRRTQGAARIERFAYDEAGRLVAHDVGGGERWEWRRDDFGNVVRAAGPGGMNEEIERDGLGRPIAVRRGEGALPTRFSWDGDGRLISIAGPKGGGALFSYDGAGRLAAERFPDGTERRFAHDRRDLVTRATDRNGSLLEMEYDSAGRLVARRARPVKGVLGTRLQRFEWDGLDRLLFASDENDPGDPGDDAVTRFSYDSLSRPVTEQAREDLIARGFDDADGTISLALPSGASFSFVRGVRGDLLSVLEGGERVVGIERAKDGAVSAVRFGAELRLAISRDESGRPSRWSFSTARAGTLLDSRLQFDAAGRIVAAVSKDGTESSFRRDAAGRLIAVEEMCKEGSPCAGKARSPERRWLYAYDASSNLLSAEGPGGGARFAVNGLDQCVAREETPPPGEGEVPVSSEGGARIAYDAAGNLFFDGERDYRYDVFGRLAEVWREGRRVATYRYDAFDRRVAKITGAGEERVLWNGWQLVEERSTGGRRVAFLPHEGLQTPLAAIEGDQRRYLLARWDGSVLAMADEEGRILERCGYDPYGALTEDGCRDLSLPFRFGGQISDDETGLIYSRQRYYHPGLARFLTPDPLGFKSSTVAPAGFEISPELSYHRGLGGASRATLPAAPIGVDAEGGVMPFGRASIFPQPFREGEANLYLFASGDPTSHWDPLGLASLLFDRSEEKLSLWMENGGMVGSYRAANRTVNPRGEPLRVGSRGPFPNGTYSIGVPQFASAAYRDGIVARFEEAPFEPGSHLIRERSWKGKKKGEDYHPSFGRIWFNAGSWASDAMREDRIVAERLLRIHGGRHDFRARTRGCIRVDDGDLEILALDAINLRRLGDPVTRITVRD